MTREHWERVKEIFGEALDQPTAERERYIHDAADGDADLLAELLRLLKESERESDLLSRPALANARALSREDTPRFAPSSVLARRFRIVRFIARGGMGEVYEAEDMELGERVAVKAIRRRAASDIDIRALFKREIQLARRVTHPNVCRIFDLAQHEDGEKREPILLLSMELIDGQSLREYLRTNGPLSPRSALPLIEDIAAGLQAIHDAGIVHGDLKPGNVMLEMRSGETTPHARVMDFGMALPLGQGTAPAGSTSGTVTASSPGDDQPTLTLRPSGPGLIGGTPDYLAPEQSEGASPTIATDVYALALVIADMLGVARTDRLNAAGERIPSAWSRILRRCLSSQPSRRYTRPAELAAALRRANEGKSKRRKIAVVALCTAAAILIAAKRIDILLRGKASGMVMAESLTESLEAPSPEGKYLAGESWDTGDLILREVSNGKMHRLTHKGTTMDAQFGGAWNPKFSPTGRQIVYTWRNSRFQDDLRIIGVDGKGERTIYRGPDRTDVSVLDWSPDGSEVLVYMQGLKFEPPQLASVTVTDGSVHVLDRVPPTALGGLFGSDRGSILFTSRAQANDTFEVRQLVLATGAESSVVARTGSNHPIGWSPDRHLLIFSSDRRGQPGIWAVPVNNQGAVGEARELVPNAKGWESLGVTRSGALFYRQDTSTVDVYTAVLDIAEGRTVSQPQRVTERFIGVYATPNWSEDGRFLVFDSHREAPVQSVAIYDRQTSDIRELRLDLEGAGRPQWVEHGAAIMVVGKSRNGPRGLYRIDPRTGSASLFRSGKELETGFEGAWSADGRFHFNRFQDFSRGIFRLDLQTGERRVLYVPPAGIAMGQENLTLSPDGRSLAFHVRNDADGASSLMVVPAQGGAAKPLFSVKTPYRFLFASFTWTPDSRTLLAAATRDLGHPPAEQKVSEIWRVPVDGGTPVKIEFPAMPVMCLRLNPDGKTIAFHSNRYRSEIWVLQNFL